MAASAKHEKLESKIAVFAILSRMTLIYTQVVFNAIIPDHDAGVFNPPEERFTLSVIQYLTSIILGGFRRWDAVYFTHIAEHGYTYENTLAFFPVYPLLVWILSNSILYPLNLVLNYGQVILLSGVILNVYLFLQSAKCVFRLGQIITKNDTIAYKAALLFCINPASVFMTAPYSEVLYTYLSLLGMIQLEKGRKFSASIFFGLSCATRSNGLLNIGYLLYRLSHDLQSVFRRIRKVMMLSFATFFSTLWIFIAFNVFPCGVYILTCLVPFLTYQYYCYVLYCEQRFALYIPDHIREYGRSEGLKLLGDKPSPWCQNTVPLAYSYVQRHYWSQGFLNYWELKQIPNFLLAVPITALVVYTSVVYFKHNRYICLTLGFSDADYNAKKELPEKVYYQLEGTAALPYVIHALVFTVFGWFFIHVQVLTRLLFSANPVLLWSAAHLVSLGTPVQPRYNRYAIDQPEQQPIETAENMGMAWKNLLTNQIISFKTQDFTTKLVIGYFIGYFVIGTLLFCNFLPWT